MKLQHQSLEDRWDKFTLSFQMANIGTEVERAIRWQKKGQGELAKKAIFRALELIDLTIKSHSISHQIK